MDYRPYRFSLDLSRAGTQTIIQGIRQGDVNFHKLIIDITDKGRPVVFDDFNIAVATMYAVKEDDKKIVGSCEIEDNKVVYTLGEQDTTVPGISTYQLEVTLQKQDGEDFTKEVFTTQPFLVVIQSTKRINVSKSVDDFSQYQDILLSIENLKSVPDDISHLFEYKADKSNTLDGYGIVNAYTKTETNKYLDGKLDKRAVDTAPSLNSPALITSGAVYNAMSTKLNDTEGVIQTKHIEPLAVTTECLDASCVTYDELAPQAVGTAIIQNGAVTESKLSEELKNEIASKADDTKVLHDENEVIETKHIAPRAVTTECLGEKSVTYDKVSPETVKAINLGVLETSKKQLISLADMDTTVNGLHIVVKNNHISIKGTASKTESKFIAIDDGILAFKSGIDYAVSVQNLLTGSTNTSHIQIYLWYISNNSDSKSFNVFDQDRTEIINTTVDKNIQISIAVEAGTYDKEFDFQIEYGTASTDFEPYHVIPNIANGSVTKSKLSDEVKNEIASKADDIKVLHDENEVIKTHHIEPLAVTTECLDASCVTYDELAPQAVGTAIIQNGAVTKSKLANDVIDELTKKADKSLLSNKNSHYSFKNITEIPTEDNENEYYQITQGYYYSSQNGNTEEGWERIAPIVSCKAGDIFKITSATSNLNGCQSVVKCYDSDKKLKSSYLSATSGALKTFTDKIFVVPEGVNYIGFSCRQYVVKDGYHYSLSVEKAVPYTDEYGLLANTLVPSLPTCELFGKSVYSDGDSVAQGTGTGNRSYAYLLADKYNMNLTSKAVGNTTLAVKADRTDSIYERIKAITNDIAYDYILLDGGTNDVSYNVPLGAITDGVNNDFDPSTILGALEGICQHLNTTQFKAKKLFIFVTNRVDGQFNKTKDTFGKMKEVLRKWGIPYVDLSNVNNLGNWNDAVASEYYIEDKLHPNLKAHKEFYLPYIEKALLYGGYINS